MKEVCQKVWQAKVLWIKLGYVHASKKIILELSHGCDGWEMYSFSLTMVMCGFDIYKNVWEPTIAEALSCEKDVGNTQNIFAFAIKNSSEVVGHVPRFLSSIYLIFIWRGGEICSM